MAEALLQIERGPARETRERPLLSVVVPARNAEATLRECVMRLLRHAGDDVELIVVDDASNRPARDLLADHPRVRILRNESRRGAARSRNRGAGAARGDVLFFVDADVFVRPDTLERVRARFAEPGTDAVIGLYDPDSCYRRPWSRFYNLRMTQGLLAAGESGDICLSAVFAVRRALFERTGGFSPRFVEASVEDVEYGLRLYSLGYPIVRDAGLRVHHQRETGPLALARNDFRRAADRVQFVAGRSGLRRVVERRAFAAAPWGQLLGALAAPLMWAGMAVGLAVHPLGWVLAAVALLTVLGANLDYLRVFRRHGGTRCALAGALILPLDLTIAAAGIAAGLARHAMRKVARYARYLSHLKHFLIKRSPAEVTLFVTDACNARCSHCFYHENLNRKTPGLLNLDEQAKLFRSLRPLLRVLLSGGEPFLRRDLPELIETIVREARPRHVTIPTNGLWPERTAELVESMLSRCPETTINVSFSVLGLKETHDRVVQVPGGFRKLRETHRRLRDLQRFFPNLLIGAIITQSKTNQHEIEATYRMVRDEMRPDNISFSLIRGASKQKEEMEVDLEPYKRVVQMIRSDGYRGRFPFWRLFARHKHLLYDYVVKVFEQNRYFYPCYSGRLRVVITPEGQVYPCEILMLRDKDEFRMGNVRDAGCDAGRIRAGDDAKRINGFIRDTRCFCRHECDMSTNLFFNPRMFARLFRERV